MRTNIFLAAILIAGLAQIRPVHPSSSVTLTPIVGGGVRLLPSRDFFPSGLLRTGVEDALPFKLEYRLALEFDLSLIPPGSTINSALLGLQTANPDAAGTTAIYGYAGNGSIETADMTAGSLLLTFIPTLTGDVHEVTGFVATRYSSGDQWAGFSIRQEPLLSLYASWTEPTDAFPPVLIVDFTPPCSPVITPAEPKSLWPPNHKYQTITVAQCVVSVTGCAGLSVDDVVITQVTSDEPENTPGNDDGNTTKDMKIANNCKSVQLRRERQNSGNGRVYTIHLSIDDGNGNTGAATCLVTVPKCQSGNPAVDDGPAYTVNGSCSGLSKMTGSEEASSEATLPEAYALEQNYPNPFNPSTVIGFQLPVASEVSLSIYNMSGQLVKQVASGMYASGRHQIVWDATDERGGRVASGVYLYVIKAGSFSAQRKLILMK